MINNDTYSNKMKTKSRRKNTKCNRKRTQHKMEVEKKERKNNCLLRCLMPPENEMPSEPEILR